jgi:ParB family chromosome partitioning protein
MSQRTSQNVLIGQIICPSQVREHFDPEAHSGLTATVREHGILVAVLLRRVGGKLYLEDGARRIRAAKAAGLTSVPAVIEDAEMAEADITLRQMILNCQREDLTPIEKAKAIESVMKSSGATATQVAAKLGMSNAMVTRHLSLLTLSGDVQARVEAGELSPSVAYEIAKIEDPAEQAKRIADAVGGKVTRDQLVGARKAKHNSPDSDKSPSRVTAKLPEHRTVSVTGPNLNLDAFIAALEELLSRARQARTKGLGLSTFTQMLADQASAQRNTHA